MDTILSNYYDKTPRPFHAGALTACNDQGDVICSSIQGTQTADPAGPAVNEDSIFWVASLTKIVTAVAVMIVVERGLISLDDDVGQVVPELAAPEVLTGFDEDGSVLDGDSRCLMESPLLTIFLLGKPIVYRTEKKLTLRHLLTHTSGFTFSLICQNLQKWAAYHGRNIDHTQGTYESITYPLIFEPGEDWRYGPGVDWAGRVVEVLSGKRLEEFIHENICVPLDLQSTTFHPETLPTFEKRKVEIALRNGDGSLTPIKEIFPLPTPDDLGGGSLYSTPREFTKFLSALLAGGRGVIKPKSVDEIFRPQLPENVRLRLNQQINMPEARAMKWSFTTGDQVDFGLAVAVTVGDVPDGRADGTVSWGGHTNTHFWIDRKTGICATSFFQHLPPSDPQVIALRDEFETELYRQIRHTK
ncbi:esterase EstB [Aspergillus udagawae]|uniref:Esterase EstB n=1 Tax=Aspergillus udagawae TaxID=91492 RepID=A0ABQ1B2F1_9EURO|nr:esterase EstB [Aspergillus udagawae]